MAQCLWRDAHGRDVRDQTLMAATRLVLLLVLVLVLWRRARYQNDVLFALVAEPIIRQSCSNR